MSTQHATEQLLAYVSGELDDYQIRNIEAHLAGCTDCRRELASLQQIWEDLGTLPEKHPGEHLRANVYSMIDAYEQGERTARSQESRPGFLERFLLGNPVIRFGLAILLLVAGGVIGYRLHTEPVDGTQLYQLQAQVKDIRRLLTISLLQQQSASERLRGVSMSNELGSTDPEVVTALLHTLKYDANVNVRLAALDALTEQIRQQPVQDEVLKALPKQNSPLVQIAIIDMLLQSHNRDVVEVLKRMLQDPLVNKNVKDHIQKSINAAS